MTKRISLYAGSFDPITLGHLDIVEQALKVFDVVHVAVGQNPKKMGTFSPSKRIELIKDAISTVIDPISLIGDRVSVGSYAGSIMAYARSIGADAIVRGLRQVSDFDDEFKLHGVLERVAPDLPVVYMIGQQQFLHVSSSTAKELASLGEDMSWLVTQNVATALAACFPQEK